MKFFKNRFVAAFVIALIAVSLILMTPKKQADATGAILAAAQNAATQVINQMINQAMSQVANTLQNTILGDFLPFMQNTWTQFSREQRMADVENMSAYSDIVQAGLTEEYKMKNEELDYDIQKDHLISEGECQVVTATVMSNAGHKDVDAYNKAFSTMISDDTRSTGTGITAFGPIVANRQLLNFRLENSCSKDEYNGNLANLCQNTNDENVDKDLRTDLLTECHTFAKEDVAFVAQMIRYLVLDVESETPMSQAQLEDPDQQSEYLERVRERAKKSSFVEYVKSLAAERMEPDTCPSTADGFTRKDFANKIDSELGRPERPDRPCPSQAEFECYRQKYQFQSPSFALRCDEGEAQMERCQTLVKNIHNELQLEMIQLKEKEAFITQTLE